MADAAAPPAAAAKLQKKNDGVATAAHAFLFALLALASLGHGRLYVLLGAVACTCVTFVVARRAPAAVSDHKTVERFGGRRRRQKAALGAALHEDRGKKSAEKGSAERSN